MIRKTWLSLFLILPAAAVAAPQPPAANAAKPGSAQSKVGSMDESIPTGARGYWFYLNHPEARVRPPLKLPPKCTNEQTWNSKCGFVKPSSFAMQSHERDALLQRMVMHPGDPNAVLAVQRYMHWIVHQAEYVANVWKFNNAAHPSLNPATTSPISALGLNLAHQFGRTDQNAVWAAVRKQGGFLVAFSKSDCDYCQSEVGPLQGVMNDTGLPLWNATIGGDCLKAFASRCMSLKQSILPARILHVSIVPALFLYLPDNTWIRVAVGLTPTDVIESRMYNLFVSWKLAASGMAKATGDTGLALDPSAMPKDTHALQVLLDHSIDKTPKTPKDH